MPLNENFIKKSENLKQLIENIKVNAYKQQQMLQNITSSIDGCCVKKSRLCETDESEQKDLTLPTTIDDNSNSIVVLLPDMFTEIGCVKDLSNVPIVFRTHKQEKQKQNNFLFKAVNACINSSKQDSQVSSSSEQTTSESL